MLCDKTAGVRVQTSHKKAGRRGVDKGSESECSDEGDIKGGMDEEVVDGWRA
jgi:hypothetical protein